MLGNPTNSNQYFETAENLIDEYHSNVRAEVAALLPTRKHVPTDRKTLRSL